MFLSVSEVREAHTKEKKKEKCCRSATQHNLVWEQNDLKTAPHLKATPEHLLVKIYKG